MTFRPSATVKYQNSKLLRVRLWAILHIPGTNFLGFQGIIKNQKFSIFKASWTFPWGFFTHFQPIYANSNTKTQKYQKKISKFQSWHFSIIFDYKLLQWVQGFQAWILAIFKGFQAFTVKNLEIRGDLERRFSVKISRNDGFQKHGKKMGRAKSYCWFLCSIHSRKLVFHAR